MRRRRNLWRIPDSDGNVAPSPFFQAGTCGRDHEEADILRFTFLTRRKPGAGHRPAGCIRFIAVINKDYTRQILPR